MASRSTWRRHFRESRKRPGPPRPLHPVLRDEVCRIGREGLINAFRYARAKRIEIELQYSSSHLRVLVRDDGCGIDPETPSSGRDGHYDLVGMREKADQVGARFNVFSGAGAGTEIELDVPGRLAFQGPPPQRWLQKVRAWKLRTNHSPTGNNLNG